MWPLYPFIWQNVHSKHYIWNDSKDANDVSKFKFHQISFFCFSSKGLMLLEMHQFIKIRNLVFKSSCRHYITYWLHHKFINATLETDQLITSNYAYQNPILLDSLYLFSGKLDRNKILHISYYFSLQMMPLTWEEDSKAEFQYKLYQSSVVIKLRIIRSCF